MGEFPNELGFSLGSWSSLWTWQYLSSFSLYLIQSDLNIVSEVRASWEFDSELDDEITVAHRISVEWKTLSFDTLDGTVLKNFTRNGRNNKFLAIKSLQSEVKAQQSLLQSDVSLDNEIGTTSGV